MRQAIRKGVTLSASVSCMDLMNLQADLEKVHKSAVSFLHFDVVDGRFNDCFILGTPTLKALRKHTSLPIEAHLAVYEPERYLAQFVDAGADYIAFHVETQPLDRSMALCDKIRSLGALPVIAFRVETMANDEMAPLLRQSAWALKLLVQPGHAGQKINPAAMDSLRGLARVIREHAPEAGLQADGNVNRQTIPGIVDAGADILTGGTSGLFLGGDVAGCARDMLAAAERSGTQR